MVEKPRFARWKTAGEKADAGVTFLRIMAFLLREITSVRHLADLLAVSVDLISAFLRDDVRSRAYYRFEISKKSGGARTITAPCRELKQIQRRLKVLLELAYTPPPCVQAYTSGRSIVSNASMHVGCQAVLNIDLTDFFPSIHFGRIAGMLSAPPYACRESVARAMASLVCVDAVLPQGAPTSPVISNMIAQRMDRELMRIAELCRCNYSRYADDMTFSGTFRALCFGIAEQMPNKSWQAGVGLRKCIESNGFLINEKKTRLRCQGERQQVTGLITNEKVNVPRSRIRQIRGMLNAWEKYGIDAANAEFERRRAIHSAPGGRKGSHFQSVLEGYLSFLKVVRGADDPLFQRLVRRYEKLTGRLTRLLVPKSDLDAFKAVFVTEKHQALIKQSFGDSAAEIQKALANASIVLTEDDPDGEKLLKRIQAELRGADLDAAYTNAYEALRVVFGERWARLDTKVQRHIASSVAQSGSGNPVTIMSAIQQAAVAVEIQLRASIFDPLRRGHTQDTSTNGYEFLDKDAKKSAQVLDKYLADKKSKIDLSSMVWICRNAGKYPAHEKFRPLCEHCAHQYRHLSPILLGRVADLMDDNMFEAVGIKKSLCWFRTAVVHDDEPDSEAYMTPQSYSVIFKHVLQPEVELLFLLSSNPDDFIAEEMSRIPCPDPAQASSTASEIISQVFVKLS